MSAEINSPARKVLMVCTRQIPDVATNGRERTMAFVLKSLSKEGSVLIFQLHSILEEKSICRFVWSFLVFFGALFKFKPIPIQATIFVDPKFKSRISELIQKESIKAVYFDGVRSGHYAKWVKEIFPDLQVVCDFDDLMSRRIAVLAKSKQSISAGYLKRYIPEFIQRHVLGGFLGKCVLRYEQKSLERVEREIAEASDCVVLVSSVEADLMRSKGNNYNVKAIPPSIEPHRDLEMITRIDHFIFIGSDQVLQNRKSIEFLVDLWDKVQPKCELRIYGRQYAKYPPVHKVVFHGFVESLDLAYRPGAVALAPAFVQGGVKTKVIEALSFGIIPIGNSVAFEGVNGDSSGLNLCVEDFESLIRDPNLWIDRINSGGRLLFDGVVKSHSVERLQREWQLAVWPDLV